MATWDSDNNRRVLFLGLHFQLRHGDFEHAMIELRLEFSHIHVLRQLDAVHEAATALTFHHDLQDPSVSELDPHLFIVVTGHACVKDETCFLPCSTSERNYNWWISQHLLLWCFEKHVFVLNYSKVITCYGFSFEGLIYLYISFFKKFIKNCFTSKSKNLFFFGWYCPIYNETIYIETELGFFFIYFFFLSDTRFGYMRN